VFEHFPRDFSTEFDSVIASAAALAHLRDPGIFTGIKFQDLSEPFKLLLERSIGLRLRPSASHGASLAAGQGW
jgi:hypothetical protein